MAATADDPLTASLRQDPRLLALLEQYAFLRPRGARDAAETVLFAQDLTKINSHNRRQQRRVVLTPFALYTFAPKKMGKFKRRICLSLLQSVTVVSQTPKFIVHVNGEYDYELESPAAGALLAAVSAAREALMGSGVTQREVTSQAAVGIERTTKKSTRSFSALHVRRRRDFDLDAIIESLLNPDSPQARDIREADIHQLCHHARESFLQGPMLVEIDAPVNIVGDVHGQYQDLLRYFSKLGMPPEARYLFLGDYVDRGDQGLEVIVLLLALKVRHPDCVTLLRGNHEVSSITRIYGFYDECKRRYSAKLWRIFCDCFNCMPIAAVVGGTIFCVHGGISPALCTEPSLDAVRALPRPCEIPDAGVMADLAWADPADEPGFNFNASRKVSYTFGPDVLQQFLERQGLGLVVRAHQVVEDGYQFFASRQLVTIFSAPHYTGRFQNAAGVMTVSDELSCSFEIFPGSAYQRGFVTDDERRRLALMASAGAADDDDDDEDDEEEAQEPAHAAVVAALLTGDAAAIEAALRAAGADDALRVTMPKPDAGSVIFLSRRRRASAAPGTDAVRGPALGAALLASFAANMASITRPPGELGRALDEATTASHVRIASAAGGDERTLQVRLRWGSAARDALQEVTGQVILAGLSVPGALPQPPAPVEEEEVAAVAAEESAEEPADGARPPTPPRRASSLPDTLGASAFFAAMNEAAEEAENAPARPVSLPLGRGGAAAAPADGSAALEPVGEGESVGEGGEGVEEG